MRLKNLCSHCLMYVVRKITYKYTQATVVSRGFAHSQVRNERQHNSSMAVTVDHKIFRGRAQSTDGTLTQLQSKTVFGQE